MLQVQFRDREEIIIRVHMHVHRNCSLSQQHTVTLCVVWVESVYSDTGGGGGGGGGGG